MPKQARSERPPSHQTPRRSLNRVQWVQEAEARFGPDPKRWAFKCPVCGHVATLQDWKDAGAPETAAMFSCVGRWLPGGGEAFGKSRTTGPCNYAGGGLFRLNPVSVNDGEAVHQVFEFATPEEVLAARGRKEAGEGEVPSEA